MEENQAMMSRAELHSMIAQLEEAELKSSSKPATELSGIRTNPLGIAQKKAELTQEDKQLSWRFLFLFMTLCRKVSINHNIS